MTCAPSLRSRLQAGDLLIGSFVKTPSHAVVEVMAQSGFDFLVLDAEHAPFDRGDLDRSLLAARAWAMPTLVRLPDTIEQAALNALDLGAQGVLVPHVRNARSAQAAVAACRYVGGARGFSNSPRAGRYGGLSMPDMIDQSDTQTSVWCQIEDRDAIEQLDAITAIDGVDCLFIGRADLAVSYGVRDLTAPVITDAVERTCAAARRAGRAVGIFLPDAQEVAACRALGIQVFVIGSDQSLLRRQGSTLTAACRAA